MCLAGAAHADEVYVGAFAHDVSIGTSENSRERGQDIDIGYRSGAVQALKPLGRPRLYADFAGNDAGRTSSGALGFLWRDDWFRERLYGQVGFGLALHDNYVKYRDPYAPALTSAETERRLAITRDFKALGSRFLFQPSLGLGWRLGPRLALEADWVHVSNAHILGRTNPGLDDVGGRVVWRFGPARR